VLDGFGSIDIVGVGVNVLVEVIVGVNVGVILGVGVLVGVGGIVVVVVVVGDSLCSLGKEPIFPSKFGSNTFAVRIG
jgi:hypothetical protein